MSLFKEFTKGIWEKNPVLVLTLGLCPTLATSGSLKNAVGMGLSVIAVLTFSNIIISLIKGFVPSKIRIPCYIIVIAFLVTVVDMLIAGFAPELSKAIGLFIKLIVVNCIILGRAEAFAAKNNVLRSALDGLGMGIGFLIAIVIIASIREILGANKFFGLTVFPGWDPIGIMILPAGALLTFGLVMACRNALAGRKQK